MNDFEKTVLEQLSKLEVGQKELKKNVKDQLESINAKLKNLEDGQKELKTQVGENTAILKALEHSSEVNKAEHDKMSMDVAKLSGTITELRTDMSTVEIIVARNNLDLAKLKAVSNQ